MNLSNLIGKQIFIIYDNMFFGTVNNVAFNNSLTKIIGLYGFDNDENEYYLKTSNIYAIDDFITVKNINKVEDRFNINSNFSPIGKPVVSILGKNYGQVIDCIVDEKFNVISFLSNNNNTFIPKNILQFANNIIIGKDVKLYSFKPKARLNKMQSLDNINVNIMKIEEPKTSNISLMPPKLTVNYDSLLGKKLTKPIYGKNNEIILKENQKLNYNNIFLAKQHNKLNELFYSIY